VPSSCRLVESALLTQFATKKGVLGLCDMYVLSQ